MAYTKRNVGDIVNGAVLLHKINNQKWEMRCKCGNVFIAQPSYTSGMCRECAIKLASEKNRIHGESPNKNKNATRLYRIWLGMKSRCNNPNVKTYCDYGGRGIKVCDEWSNYLQFKKWAINSGYADNLSIDRIDNNGDYCPDNCRWSTNLEQGNNKRNNHILTFNGVSKTMAEWAREKGINYHTLKRRINTYGYSVEDALTKPIQNVGA